MLKIYYVTKIETKNSPEVLKMKPKTFLALLKCDFTRTNSCQEKFQFCWNATFWLESELASDQDCLTVGLADHSLCQELNVFQPFDHWYDTVVLGTLVFFFFPTELHLIKIILHFFWKISIFLYMYINSLVRRQAKLFYLTAPFMEVSFGHFYLWFCLFPWLCIEISVRLFSILSRFWFTVFIFGAWSLCISLSREKAGFL